MKKEYAAIEGSSGWIETGEVIRTHSMNPNYFYIRNRYGMERGGIIVKGFNGPFFEQTKG